MSTRAAPLSEWRFEGTLRHYQADVLDNVSTDEDSPLHIVAPPGSGKTILGMLLAMRRGRRAVAFAPTATIRAQWADTARDLAPVPEAVSEDPTAPGDFSALTYQALSVLDSTEPFAPLALQRWASELVGEGQSASAAQAWLTDLQTTNARAFRAGIMRRARAVRKNLVREDPEALANALHPNARALIDRLVAQGTETIILDECHHLLDHWALVVAVLVAKLREAGFAPLVIGLTATLPSLDDTNEYDNYTGLLGDVDYEVPTPAVVREGNLSPYRAFVHFVEPTAQELSFLRSQADALALVLNRHFAKGSGRDYVLRALQPPLPEMEFSELEPPPPVDPDDPDQIDARLAVAFAADFASAEAMAALLGMVLPQHSLVRRLPDEARRLVTAEESLRLLARFALDELLPDPARASQWKRIQRTLADFGYRLTDRGLRRSRDPVDTMLASSLAKDYAVADILRREGQNLGDERMRAVVVADYIEHGNTHGGLISKAGALRTFDVVVSDTASRHLRCVLVTGDGMRIAARDADQLVDEIGVLVNAPVAAAALTENPDVAVLHAPGIGTAELVGAATELLTRGSVQVLVGTRGLFGEGWDCPAANTLIDLSSAATSSATQQLRGRTLRLDPAWPEKVAHNWSVVAVLPADFSLDATPDVTRMRRKHAHLWGLDRDEATRIVRGLSSALTERQCEALRAVTQKQDGATVVAINEAVPTLDRERTRIEWRVGEPYRDREIVSARVPRRPGIPVFRTSERAAKSLLVMLVGVGVAAIALPAILAVIAPGLVPLAIVLCAALAIWQGVPLAKAWSRTRADSRDRVTVYRRIAEVVWESLRHARRVSDVPAICEVRQYAAQDEVGAATGAATGAVTVEIECREVAAGESGGSSGQVSVADQRVFAEAVAEIFAPVRTPRFLLEVRPGGSGWLVNRALGSRRGQGEEQYLTVPTLIGRRQDDAVAFAALWKKKIGDCVLHALDRPEALAVAARARRSGGSDAARALSAVGSVGLSAPTVGERWA